MKSGGLFYKFIIATSNKQMSPKFKISDSMNKSPVQFSLIIFKLGEREVKREHLIQTKYSVSSSVRFYGALLIPFCSIMYIIEIFSLIVFFLLLLLLFPMNSKFIVVVYCFSHLFALPFFCFVWQSRGRLVLLFLIYTLDPFAPWPAFVLLLSIGSEFKNFQQNLKLLNYSNARATDAVTHYISVLCRLILMRWFNDVSLN